MSTLLMEKVQTSFTSEIVAEKGIIREIGKSECKLDYERRKIFENRSRIRELNRKISKLKKVLSTPLLSKEFINFITYRYKLNRSVNWIANEMYGGLRVTLIGEEKKL